MAYIALKPCKFGGQQFKIGNTIPEEVLLPGAIKNLVKMEVIASTDGAPVKGSTSHQAINITIKADEGDLPLEISEIGLQQIFDALTTNVEGAENIIETMTDGDALILLHMCDSRKGVKTAAEDRAKALNESEEEEEAQEEQETPEEEETEDSAGEE